MESTTTIDVVTERDVADEVWWASAVVAEACPGRFVTMVMGPVTCQVCSRISIASPAWESTWTGVLPGNYRLVSRASDRVALWEARVYPR